MRTQVHTQIYTYFCFHKWISNQTLNYSSRIKKSRKIFPTGLIFCTLDLSYNSTLRQSIRTYAKSYPLPNTWLSLSLLRLIPASHFYISVFGVTLSAALSPSETSHRQPHVLEDPNATGWNVEQAPHYSSSSWHPGKESFHLTLGN